MDRPTIAAVIGVVLGLAAGVAGMLMFPPAPEVLDDGSAARVLVLEEDLEAERKAHSDTLGQRDALARAATSDAEIAGDHERLAREKGDLSAKFKAARDELRALKSSSAEELEASGDRVSELAVLLEKNGVFSHLSPEQIRARMEKHEIDFRNAFDTKDKKAAMAALRDLQRLGPAAYDKAIELWKIMAEDYGLNPFGEGPGTLKMNMPDYVSLITEFEMIRKGLTDPDVDSSFRIASLYGLPWWGSEDAAERARLAGELLLQGEGGGYQAKVAAEALKDIQDPSAVRYLTDFLAKDTKNDDARIAALQALIAKNDDQGWAAIEVAARDDPSERVRQTAAQALAQRSVGVAGVLITWVGKESQAVLAGIRTGDILTHYNGVRIKTISAINEAKKAVGPEESVKVVLVRGEKTLTITLGPGMIGINGVAVAPKND